MSKDSKVHLLSHSAAKVELLGKYIARFLSIITNDGYTEAVHIYDLFCGEGQYQDGGHGSPLVIMKAVKAVYFRQAHKINTFPKINCYFSDSTASKVESTSAAIEEKKLHYDSFGQLTCSTDNYRKLLPAMIEQFSRLRNEKAFVFIDPYGYKDVRMQDIADLMSTDKAEVLLWLPIQFMYRFQSDGTPAALKSFLEELGAYDEWSAAPDVWAFVEMLKGKFQEFMKEGGFVDTFTIQKDANTVFCLFFFTSHIKGFEKMLETKWDVDKNYGRGWSYHGPDDLFSPLKSNPLEKKLISFLDQPRTNGELFRFTLECRFLPKHTYEILDSWQQEGRIKVTKEDGSNARKRSSYLNYKDYDKSYSKVTVSKT